MRFPTCSAATGTGASSQATTGRTHTVRDETPIEQKNEQEEDGKILSDVVDMETKSVVTDTARCAVQAEDHLAALKAVVGRRFDITVSLYRQWLSSSTGLLLLCIDFDRSSAAQRRVSSTPVIALCKLYETRISCSFVSCLDGDLSSIPVSVRSTMH